MWLCWGCGRRGGRVPSWWLWWRRACLGKIQSVRSRLRCVAVLPVVPLDPRHFLQLLLCIARQLARLTRLQVDRHWALHRSCLQELCLLWTQIKSDPGVFDRPKFYIVVCAKARGEFVVDISLDQLAGGGNCGGSGGGGAFPAALGSHLQLANTGSCPLKLNGFLLHLFHTRGLFAKVIR